MKRFILFIIGLIICAKMPLYSQETMRIVVMNLKEEGVSQQTAKTVTNMIRTEFINLGKFTVVERAQMDAILKEQGMQQSGCTDQECAVQVGRLMSAKKILVGEVSPMGKSLIMTVRIVDVEKGVSEFAAQQKAESEDVLDEAVAKIVDKLASRIEKGAKTAAAKEKKDSSRKKEEVEDSGPSVKTPMGYYLRGIVPGWGQFYAGSTVKGYVFSGLFVFTGAMCFLSIQNYNKTKKDYEDLGQGLPQSEYDSKYDKYESASGGAKIFTTLFVLTYVANWVDIIWFNTPDYSSAGYMSLDKDTYFTFNTYRVSPLIQEKSLDFEFGIRY